MPIVSIILPTHNGARFIERAIASVRTQTFVDWELVVIDDGSTDGTAQIVAKLAEEDARIRLVQNEHNLGIQKTLNTGLAHAAGKYIARIDDDDAWTDEAKLSAQVAYLDSHPDCVLIGTGARVVDEEGRESFRYRFPETDAAIRRSMLSKNCFAHASVVFRKDTALRVGAYGEGVEVRHVEDHDLWLRLGMLGSLANLSTASVTLTARPDSLSSINRHDQFRKALVLAKKYRDSYPGYLSAFMRGTLRLWLFSFFAYVPKVLRPVFMRFYKRYW